MNLRCKKINIVPLYSWFTLWEGGPPLASFHLPQKSTDLFRNLKHTQSYPVLTFSHHPGKCDRIWWCSWFRWWRKGADSPCSQSEPVSLVLDLALRRAWIWPCLFISLGNSLNCFPTMSSKQQSQHSINRLGVFLASGFPQHRKQLLFSLHSC